MKYVKYPFLIILAGTCTGIFFLLKAMHTLRAFGATDGDASLLWTFAPLPTIGKYVLLANVGLLMFWLLYSCLVSMLSGTRLSGTLRVDAYTYLPLCLLAFPLSQFNAFLTHYFEGFLLLSTSFSNLLLIGALMGVFALKIRQFPSTRIRRESSSSNASEQPPTWRLKFAIFLISFVIYFLVGMRTTTLEPGGDEPHYLLISYSLLHDRDLAINNNYEQKDYKSFHSGDLDKHICIGKDGTRYSIHPIGLPILLLPSFALDGRRGAVIFMNAVAALLALQLFLAAFAITRQKRLALMLWFVASFTTPILLYSSSLYPEIPIALLLITAYRIITSKNNENMAAAIMLGSALFVLPWLHSRLTLPAALLLLYHLINSWQASRETQWTARRVWLTLIPFGLLALSGVLMAGYYYWLFGSPFPTAAYASTGRTEVFSLSIFLKKGFWGLLFDQEAGLLVFSPFYLFLVPGFMLLMRQTWSQAAWLLILIGSIYLPCGGFTNDWQGGWSPAARYMVDLSPLFWTPFCLGMQQAYRRRIFRYTFGFLAIIAFYWSYLFLQNPLSAIMRGIGRNSVLEYYSSVVDLTRYFPSFLTISPGAYILSGFWLIAIALLTIGVYRSEKNDLTPNPSPMRRGEMDSRFSAPISENGMIAQVKTIWRAYALILAGVLLFTTIAEQVGGNAQEIRLNTNRQIHELLANFEYASVVKSQTLQQQPIASNDLRFSYGRREKQARVRKEGEPQTPVSGQHQEMRAKAESQGARILVSGPFEAFPKGKYTAYFTIKAADNTVNDAVVTIEASTRRGKIVFNQKSLRGSDFQSAGNYQVFALPYTLTQDVTNLETRVYFHNRVDISVENIAIEPDVAEFYYDAGLSALRQGNSEAANTRFLRAVAVAEHPQALYHLGVSEQSAGNWERSAELLQRAIAGQPDFADAHYRLGLAAQQSGDLERAKQAFERATQLLPNHLEAWQALEKLYRQMNLPEQTATAEQRLQELYHPQYPYAVNLGNQIAFMGYSVQNPAPGKVRLEYYWKALLPMELDYVIFVHFSGNGAKFQQDHDPHRFDRATGQSVYYPTSQWKVGELITEVFDIAAPAGAFDIELGVWDPKQTQQRLPVITSQSRFSFWTSEKIGLQPVIVQ